MDEKYSVLLTFDVEEWFQVENLKEAIGRDEWDTLPSGVERNTSLILNLLEEQNARATFFVLGWIAERHPDLVKKIAAAGHEIASHGSGHELTYNLPEEELIADLTASKKLLEELTDQPVHGYRAPSFSVDDRLLGLLKSLGFTYDSSLNPFQLVGRYGSIHTDLQRLPNGLYRTANGMTEIPISTVPLPAINFPMGGGAYFRILPLPVFKWLVKRKLKLDGIYNFYLHPWELQPDQPRIRSIKLNYQFRHYYGLPRTSRKLKGLLKYLKKQGCAFQTISTFMQDTA